MTENNQFKFRPLELELHKTESGSAGYHDLNSSHITIDALDSAITSRHEGLHGELLDHTPFGWLQHTLPFIENLVSEIKKPLVAKALHTTIEESRTAHETYATYLSVKSFSRDQEKALLSRHNKEYMAYFDTLSSVIDKSLESSYLQYLVGKALVSNAFATPLITRITSVEAILTLDIQDEESPNKRLRLILAHYDELYVEEIQWAINQCVIELIESGDIPPGFSPYVEQAWMNLNNQSSNHLDQSILKSLTGLLKLVSRNLGIPVFDHSERQLSLATELIEAAIKSESQEHNFSKTIKKIDPNSEFESEQRRIGGVKIASKLAVNNDTNSRIDNINDLETLLHLEHIVVSNNIIAKPRPIDWRILTFSRSGILSYEVDETIVTYFVKEHRLNANESGSLEVLGTVLLGISSFGSFPKIYNSYSVHFTETDKLFKFPTIFWYMGDNLVDWIHSEWLEGEISIYSSSMIQPDQEHLFEQNSTGEWTPRQGMMNGTTVPPRLFVLRSSKFHGYFVKILPGYESYKIAWKKGQLSRMDKSERTYLKQTSRYLTQAAFRTWPTF